MKLRDEGGEMKEEKAWLLKLSGHAFRFMPAGLWPSDFLNFSGADYFTPNLPLINAVPQ